MGDISSAIAIERPDLARRTMRFLAVFGIAYGLVGTVSFIELARLWQLWMAIISRRMFVERGDLITRTVINALSIWLIIGCIGVLRRNPRARGQLFVWAMCVLTFEAAVGCFLVWRGMFRQTFGAIVHNITYYSLELGLPLMLLCVSSLRTLSKQVGGAFPIKPQMADAGEMDAPDQAMHVASVHATSQTLNRCIAWISLAIGLIGTIRLIVALNNGWISFGGQHPTWRLATIAWLDLLKQCSYTLLFLCAVPMVLKHHLGQRLVLAWSILYLSMAATRFVLYDCMFVWWSATAGRMPQSPPILFAVLTYDFLRSCAFATIVFYLLMQPELSTTPRPLR